MRHGKRRVPQKHLPIDQSRLYKIRSRRELERRLNLEKGGLQSFLSRNDNYEIFDIVQKGKPEARTVQSPKFALRRVHETLFKFFRGLSVPDYLHSGVRGRSYITNAKAHIGQPWLLAVDIRKFYPSTSRPKIKQMFREVFRCSDDVAAVLADLCTVPAKNVRGKQSRLVPTGSPISQLLAFFTHKRLFDDLFNYASSRSLIMTCYVDDLTFSGQLITKADREQISVIIQKADLIPHWRKTKLYRPADAKQVTGVALTKHGIKPPNKLQKSIYEKFQELKCGVSEADFDKKLQSLLGTMRAASQIDSQFSQRNLSALRPSNVISKSMEAA